MQRENRSDYIRVQVADESGQSARNYKQPPRPRVALAYSVDAAPKSHYSEDERGAETQHHKAVLGRF